MIGYYLNLQILYLLSETSYGFPYTRNIFKDYVYLNSNSNKLATYRNSKIRQNPHHHSNAINLPLHKALFIRIITCLNKAPPKREAKNQI